MTTPSNMATERDSADPLSNKPCEICLIFNTKECATHICKTCADYLCTRCMKKHQSNPEYQDHVFESLAPAEKDYVSCEVHPKQTAARWCQTCNVAVCKACIMYTHDGHEMEDSHAHISRLGSQIQNLTSAVSKHTRLFQHTTDVIKDMVQTLDASFSQTKDQLKQQAEEMVDLIRQNEKELLSQLNETHKYRKDALAMNLSQELEKIQESQEWLRIATNGLAAVKGAKVIRDLESLVTQGEKLLCRKSADIPRSEFLTFVPEEGPQLGKLEVDNKLLKKSPIWEFKKRINLNDDLRGISFISETVMALSCRKSLAFYDIDGKDLQIKSQHEAILDDHDVVGIAAGNDGDLYFTCDHKDCKTVHLYLVKEYKLASEAEQWKRHIFQAPRGIAVNKLNQIAVTDYRREQLTLHNRDGQILWTVDNHSSQNGMTVSFDSPWFVACGPDNTIIVSDYACRQVYIFDTFGKLQRTLGGSESKDVQFKWPCGVCTDDLGHLLIADRYSNRISQFDQNGHLIKDVLSGTFAVFVNPCGIAFQKIGEHRLLALIENWASAKIFKM